MLRKRNDSVKPGKGIDGTEGENYTDAYNSYKGNYYQPDYPGGKDVPGDRDIKGRKVRERAWSAPYTSDTDQPLNDVRDFQFTAGVRDIFDDVQANSDIRGDITNANTGPIKYGVNKSQSEGSKDPRRGK